MDFLDEYFKYESGSEISGLTGVLSIFYLQKLFEKSKRNIIVLTSSLYEANKIYDNLSRFVLDSYFFPMDDFLSSMIVATSPELKFKRLETLDKIISIDKKIVVTNLMGYLKFLPSIDEHNYLEIKVNDVIKRDELVKKITDLGYKIDSLVTASGELAVRGFIVDVFPIEQMHPVRIEFDGNQIESIRYFDEITQLSFGNLNNIKIKAIEELINEKHNSLFDYCENPIVVYIDNTQIKASYLKLQEDIFEYCNKNAIKNKLMYELEDIKDRDKIFLNLFASGKYNLNALEITNYNLDFNKLVIDYNAWKKREKLFIFV